MKKQTKKLNSKKIIQVVTMLILCLILVFACIFGYSVYKDTAAFVQKNFYPLEQVSCMTVMVILCILMVAKKTVHEKMLL